MHEFVNAVAVGVQWDVFDGGLRAADRDEDAARLRAAERSREEARRAVTIGVETAWRAWRRARRELATARRGVDAARENLRIVEDQYRSGVARSSDVLDAEALLADRRFAVVARRHEAFMALVRLAATAGLDLESFLDASSREEAER